MRTVYAARRSEADAVLRQKQGKVFTNRADGRKARFGRNGREKMLSNKAVEKSKANGFTAAQHNIAAANIDVLYEGASIYSSGADKQGMPDVRIYRYSVPVSFGGTEAEARILVKETLSNGEPDGIYTVELSELRKPSDDSLRDRGSADITPDATVEGSVIILPSSKQDVNRESERSMEVTERQETLVR